MAQFQNFAEILSSLRKQRAAVSGRPPSKQEVAGVVAGIQAGAEERLSRRADRELAQELQTERIEAGAEEGRLSREATAGRFAKTLTEQKRQFGVTAGFQERQITGEEGRFATQLSQQQRQFETTAADRKREFDVNMVFNTDVHNDKMARLDKTFAENVRQFDKAAAVRAEEFESSQALTREVEAGRIGLGEGQLEQQAGQFKETREELSAVEREQLRIADQARADEKHDEKMQRLGLVVGAVGAIATGGTLPVIIATAGIVSQLFSWF